MYVVCVHIRVKPEQRESFIAGILENARGSRKEPGNLRFDVLEKQDDPNSFLLYEVYHDEDAMAAHKATEHYACWRDQADSWLAEEHIGVKYTPLFPEDVEKWRAE